MIAEELWGKYRLRNDSEIVNLFHGQVRVQTTCTNDIAHKVFQ